MTQNYDRRRKTAAAGSLHAAFDAWVTAVFEETFSHVKHAFPSVDQWDMEDVGDGELNSQMNLSFRGGGHGEYCMCTVGLTSDGKLALGAIAVHAGGAQTSDEGKSVPVNTGGGQVAKLLCDLLIAANKAGTDRTPHALARCSSPGMESETWVVVSKIENMLLPRRFREYATYHPRTGEWVGWTTPGYRSKGCRRGGLVPVPHGCRRARAPGTAEVPARDGGSPVQARQTPHPSRGHAASLIAARHAVTSSRNVAACSPLSMVAMFVRQTLRPTRLACHFSALAGVSEARLRDHRGSVTSASRASAAASSACARSGLIAERLHAASSQTNSESCSVSVGREARAREPITQTPRRPVGSLWR